MKAAVARKPTIKIAVVESDPLRFVGFRALFDTEPEFELISAGLPEISGLREVDLILLGNRSGQNLFDVMRCPIKKIIHQEVTFWKGFALKSTFPLGTIFCIY